MKPLNTFIWCATIVVLTIIISIVQCSLKEQEFPRTCEDRARDIFDECKPAGSHVPPECTALAETAIKECYAHSKGVNTDGE